MGRGKEQFSCYAHAANGSAAGADHPDMGSHLPGRPTESIYPPQGSLPLLPNRNLGRKGIPYCRERYREMFISFELEYELVLRLVLYLLRKVSSSVIQIGLHQRDCSVPGSRTQVVYQALTKRHVRLDSTIFAPAWDSSYSCSSTSSSLASSPSQFCTGNGPWYFLRWSTDTAKGKVWWDLCISYTRGLIFLVTRKGPFQDFPNFCLVICG